MSETLAKTFNYLESIADKVGNVIESNNAYSDNIKLAEYSQHVKEENQKAIRDINVVDKQNDLNLASANKKREESLNKLAVYSMTTNDVNKYIESKNVITDDMKNVMKEHGLSLNNEYEFNDYEVTSALDKQNKYRIMSHITNDINNSLNIMESDILGLNKYLPNIGTAEGWRGYKDSEDFKHFIDGKDLLNSDGIIPDANVKEYNDRMTLFKEEHKIARTKVDENGVTQFILDKNGNKTYDLRYSDNYLAKSFLTPLVKGTATKGPVGFVPFDYETASITQRNKLGKSASSKDVVNTLIDSIRMTSADADAAGEISYMKKVGINNIGLMKGPLVRFETQENRDVLRRELSSSIIKQFKYAMEADDKFNIFGKTNATDVPGYTEYITTPNETTANTLANSIVNRYVTRPMIQDPINKTMTPGPRGTVDGFFNQAYKDDGVDFHSSFFPSTKDDLRTPLFNKTLLALEGLNTYELNTLGDIIPKKANEVVTQKAETAEERKAREEAALGKGYPAK